MKDRVTRSIGRSKAEVFLRSDFTRIGSYAQVGKALTALTRKGRLVRLGYGVYARARPGKIYPVPVPALPLESLAWQALQKLGIPVQHSRAAREYIAGSTQIPATICYDTGMRRVTRTMRLGEETVSYENNFSRST